MAKKAKKKDPEKKAALQAAKEGKADKKAQKRLQKESRRELGSDDDDEDNTKSNSNRNINVNDAAEDDIDALLIAYQKQCLELSTPLIEVLGSHPADGSTSNHHTFPYPPRGNFSLTLCPTSNELYMFGGEYNNGVENMVFDELLCWNPDAIPKQDTGGTNSTQDEEQNSPVTPNGQGVWKRIIAPQPKPPARCSHSTVFYNNALYVFGGELATAENYHHYKDIWKFDIKTNLWTEIKPRNKGGPTSRSGHRALVWRHYMLIYGGFYEALRESPRWFNDLHVYDFSTNSWIECTYSKLASVPPERSAFNFGILGGADVAFVSGGYSKLKNPAPGSKAEGMVHNDCWALHLKGLESGKIPTWERLSRKGEYPSQRSGTACTVWKNKMLVYGGVQDDETENHRVNSVFFDDLFAFDMERRRWFRLNLKKKGGERRRRRKDDGRADATITEGQKVDEDSDEDDDGIEGEATSSGWDLDMLRSNMFAFIDGDGNIVYEKIVEEEEEAETKETQEASSADIDTGYEVDAGEKESSSNKEDSGLLKDDSVASIANKEVVQKMVSPGPAARSIPTIAKSEVMALGEDGAPEAVSRKTPLPRIKAQIAVRGNTMFLYGGILEVGDREVTLDDVWSIELQKREEWVCIHEGSMHKQVWKGVESDDESYISTDRDGTGGNESDDEGDFDEFDDILEEDEDEEAAKAAHKAAKKAAKKEQSKGIKEEMQALNEKLNSDDPNRTPQIGEELADFYARTAISWTQKAMESIDESIATNEQLSVKELKREGFSLAKDRYEELKHVLDRLSELEMTQKDSVERKEKKQMKKEKEKKKDRRK